jgi:hypothetical protein
MMPCIGRLALPTGHVDGGAVDEVGVARGEKGDVVQVRLSQLELHHLRQWGACWSAMEL